MLKCREVIDNADQLIADQLSWRGHLAIKVHLLLCHHCHRYMRQLKVLIRAIPLMHSKAADQEISTIMDLIHAREDQNLCGMKRL